MICIIFLASPFASLRVALSAPAPRFPSGKRGASASIALARGRFAPRPRRKDKRKKIGYIIEGRKDFSQDVQKKNLPTRIALTGRR